MYSCLLHNMSSDFTLYVWENLCANVCIHGHMCALYYLMQLPDVHRTYTSNTNTNIRTHTQVEETRMCHYVMRFGTIHLCSEADKHRCVYTCVDIVVNVCVGGCACVCVCLSLCVCVCVCIYIFMCVCIYIHV
jgi:hypothetical protein